MMKSLILLLVCSSIFMACDDEEVLLNAEISYGTSFGECVGYCIRETLVVDDEVQVTAKQWGDGAADKIATGKLSAAQQTAIHSGIDRSKFKNLPSTIGCPDCADGGAEWLELTVDGERKKVTFEYMQDIDGIAEAVKVLREVTQVLDPTDSN